MIGNLRVVCCQAQVYMELTFFMKANKFTLCRHNQNLCLLSLVWTHLDFQKTQQLQAEAGKICVPNQPWWVCQPIVRYRPEICALHQWLGQLFNRCFLLLLCRSVQPQQYPVILHQAGTRLSFVRLHLRILGLILFELAVHTLLAHFVSICTPFHHNALLMYYINILMNILFTG